MTLPISSIRPPHPFGQCREYMHIFRKILLIKKRHLLALILFASISAAAQNINIVGPAKYQPLIYRDPEGKYEGCGIRTTFFTNSPMPNHTGSFSVSIFKERGGRVIGFTKMTFSFIPNINNFKWVKNLALSTYTMNTANGKEIKLDAFKEGKEKNSLQAETTPIESANFITDILNGEQIQVGISLKGEKKLSTFAIEAKEPLSKIELSPLTSCISQVFPSDLK